MLFEPLAVVFCSRSITLLQCSFYGHSGTVGVYIWSIAGGQVRGNGAG